MAIRRWLRDELARRRARNRRYSLRAYARDLAVHHATLSRILRGRQRVTPALIARLPVSVELAAATLRAEAETAVLAAVRREAFTPSSRWIATRTGVPVDAVNAAIHRLLRTGRLEMIATDRWIAREHLRR
jgi:plasmid maintenance system antidote protein VapI